MAKPVVATAVDGTCEVIVDGETGLLVPPAQSKPLAEVLIRLLGDSEQRQLLGEAARRRAREVFSLEQQIRDTAALYRSLLEGKQMQKTEGATAVL